MSDIVEIDSREKRHAITRIVEYFDTNRIRHISGKLPVGDYRVYSRPLIVVDRKQNLSELATNLGADKRRFMNEIRLAAELGVKLYILCEHGGQIHTIEDVKNWENPHGLITGRELAERMVRVHISYNVEFLFCDKRCTGKRIAEILGVNP
jgi:hypothetical protein